MDALHQYHINIKIKCSCVHSLLGHRLDSLKESLYLEPRPEILQGLFVQHRGNGSWGPKKIGFPQSLVAPNDEKK